MADKKTTLKDASAKEAKAKDAALEAAVTQIERDFGQGSLMRLGADSKSRSRRSRPASLALDLALGIGGVPRGRIVEIFGPESSGKTTLIYHIIAEAQARGRGLRLHRHRARDGPDLRAGDRRRHRRAARLPARLRRAGAADRRPPDRLCRGRRGRDRLGRGADAESRAGRPDRRHDGRPAGTADVAGDAQTGRQPQPHQHGLPLHQPDPRKGRRPVRLAGDPAGRAGAEVLLLAAPRHPPHRDPQGRHRGGRQPGPGQSRQEQSARRPSARPSSTSSTARGSRARAACSTSASSTTWSRNRAPSSPTGRRGSGRGATTPSSSSPTTPSSLPRSRRRSGRRSESTARRRPRPPPRRRPLSPGPSRCVSGGDQAGQDAGRPLAVLFGRLRTPHCAESDRPMDRIRAA